MGMPPGRSNEVDTAVQKLVWLRGRTVDSELKDAINTVLEELLRLEVWVYDSWEQAMGEDA